jgi:hypothetical protein
MQLSFKESFGPGPPSPQKLLLVTFMLLKMAGIKIQSFFSVSVEP